jgi:GntR family transcriptional regulator
MSDSGPRIGATATSVYEDLLQRILSGVFLPGQRLGSERALAEEFWVSRSTLRQALRSLEAEGAIRRVPGRGGGTFIKHVKINRDLSQVVSVPALLQSQGVTSETRVISASLGPADEVSRSELQLSENATVLRLVRLRLAGGSPISIENAVFPADRFPGIRDEQLGGSMYELLEVKYHTLPGEAVERIEVLSATRYQAEMLDIAYGAPLLSIVRTTSDENGIPIEYSRDLFRGDRTRIVVRTPGRGEFTKAARDRNSVIVL